jgi:hypothetical protein
MYLHCLTGDRPRQWLWCLPWVELCYNSAFQSSLRTLSFWVIYGRDPPHLHAYTVGEAKLPAVDAQLQEQDEFLMEVRERLEQAQQYYKHHYDHKHWASEFAAGDWVWLRLLHWPIRGRSKLGPKYFGPFQVTTRWVRSPTSSSYQKLRSCTMYFMSMC